MFADLVPLGYILGVKRASGVRKQLNPRRLNPSKLAAARILAGYRTQTLFADAMGMARHRYSRWEGKNPPRSFDFYLMDTALRLLNCTFEDISDAEPTTVSTTAQSPNVLASAPA